MPSCGPFLLHEWKPYDRIVLRKNTRYYDAGRVLLDEIVFLPITDGATSVNLYKTGNADAMYGRYSPALMDSSFARAQGLPFDNSVPELVLRIQYDQTAVR